MKELGIALGLILVIEGALYALFPRQMIAMVKQLGEMPPSVLRATGIMVLAVGWLIVWWIKH